MNIRYTEKRKYITNNHKVLHQIEYQAKRVQNMMQTISTREKRMKYLSTKKQQW